MLNQVTILLLICTTVFCTLSTENSCAVGTTCNDNDYCTGTKDNPDFCTDNMCVAGEDVCPYYSKVSMNSNKEQVTGELQISNDDKWLYAVWAAHNTFMPSRVYLYASGTDPPQSDDASTFPYQISVEAASLIQIRISLNSLNNPTELDPIYISMRLENDAGAGSWIQGLFTPMHHTNGGSFSYTTVCNCLGYSHVEKMIDRNYEIYTVSDVDAIMPEEQAEIMEETNSAAIMLPAWILLVFVMLF